ncbi:MULTISPECIES: hypothetical protein [Salinivibrio]|uniref:Uncharacterized protein n=1 Tax=Salinivibrio sharmensis TaxID=390883 RepID=A0ABX3KIY6_9GAMM|nr:MULTISPECIES: hypothetical protein [Salinivibrio]OOE89622.1 hypothetical protein BZG74_03635 [Salinivibrio sharmensis]WBA17194.1 hypothetical protein O4598_08595 [Salinivibrio kushneri]
MNWLGNLSPVYRTPHAPPTKVWAIRKQAHIEERKQRRLDDPNDPQHHAQTEHEENKRKKDGELDIYV